jgi:hypothetical protein
MKQRFGYAWPSGSSEWISILAIDTAKLTVRNGFRLERWEEPGLGPAEGMDCELASGLVVRFATLTGGDPGSTHVAADSGIASGRGARAIVRQVVEELDLPATAVTWAGA